MNKQAWFDVQKDPKQKKPMPLISFPCVQKLGITVGQLVTDSKMQADGICAMAECSPSAAAVSMMDLSVEAEAFGAPVRFSDIEVPTVTAPIIEDIEEAEDIALPEVGAGRTALFAEAIRQTKERITDRPVFAGVIGPFSLAGRLLDMTEIMIYCYTDPEMVAATLEKCTEFIKGYVGLLKEAGADGIVMAEPAAGLLSPQLNAEFSIPYVKQILDAHRSDDFALIYHNCGNVVPLIDDILTIGADAYHFGNAIDLVELAEKIPADVPFMGNIDPVGVLSRATAEETYTITMELLEKLGDRPNFTLSSGCDVPAMAKLDNIEAFYKASADYYGK
ncbi:MAG: uroporphyrinogen decarboxylase family protein [Clostridia bacterium]|nr:uroporphyrinogen decarboxylase family protein [Clostridia bacterium]